MADSGAHQVRLLITFFSVSAALYAQKLLGKEGLRCEVIPVPRSVSSSCGYALEVLEGAADTLTDRLTDGGIEWAAIYRPVAEGKALRYEQLAVYREP